MTNMRAMAMVQNGMNGSRRAGGIGLAVLCAALCIAAVGAGTASARTITPYSYSGTSFNGSGSTAGVFERVSFLAVNDQTGNVYATDSGHEGVLSQFSATGVAVPFSDPSRNGESSIRIGGFPANGGVAVDNSGSATQGNIFMMQQESKLHAFTASGAVLNSNWPVCRTCNGQENWVVGQGTVATDSEGTPWVTTGPFEGTTPAMLNPIDPAKGALSSAKKPILIGQYFDGLNGTFCCTPESKGTNQYSFAFDSQDNVYVLARPIVRCLCDWTVMKFDKSGALLNPYVTPRVVGLGSTSFVPNQISVDLSTDNLLVNYATRVEVYSPDGKMIDSFGTGSLTGSAAVGVNSTTRDAYVSNTAGSKKVDIYKTGPPIVVPDASTGPTKEIDLEKGTMTATIDPAGGGNTTECFFEFGAYSTTLTRTAPCQQGNVLPSAGGPQAVTAIATELNCNQHSGGICFDDFIGIPRNAKGVNYFYRVVTKNAAGPRQSGEIRTFRNANKPSVATPTINRVNTDSVNIDLTVDPQGGETTYQVLYGETPGYGSEESGELVVKYNETASKVQAVTVYLDELNPGATYHYKVVVKNHVGEVETTDRTFRTFPLPTFENSCSNALSRQQTGAASLLDCRSYELVSAANQGGYNVESDLAPGQTPHPGFPEADGRVLYGIHAGGVPNSGYPTNRGVDPYIATRGDAGWSTKYVGIPTDSSTPSAAPFASTLAGADASLSAFAFGGPDICDPCFSDGSAGLPLRLPSGNLVQGMAGSAPVVDPDPAGDVAKPLSADGSHFVFGSEDKFESDGNENEISIYDRNLETGVTRVVSKTPGGATMTGPGIAQLDISADGSRILIGQLTGTDAKGNEYFHLYMNVGAAGQTIDLTPGTVAGVRYDGMTSDGTDVFFTTKDPLSTAADQDTDTSADLFHAEVSSSASTLTRASTGTEATGDTNSCTPAGNWNTPSGGPNCDVVAIAGGGGVASEDGTVFFFSPEKLDGAANGTAGQPNLYIARPGAAPKFVVTLETANPAVKHGIETAGTRNTADFQVNPSGDVSALSTTLPLKPNFENRGFSQVYRYDADSQELVCMSCDPSNAPAIGKAGLAFNGLSITDDGRVFFNAVDPLALRDSNGKQDVYEWSNGVVELISSGSNENDSSLLSVTRDGRDALFFTREKLAPQDQNGPVVKVYDAREEGGFFFVPPPQPCKASDECHGAGTVQAPLPRAQSIHGTDGQLPPTTTCRKGFVKKKGKCVRKKPKKKPAKKKNKRHGPTRGNG